MKFARLVAATVAFLAGCGGAKTTPPPEGRFTVSEDGRQLAIKCLGDGSPTVVIDAGSDSPGIAEFQDQPWVSELAEVTRVCMYDRAGLGSSDPAPDGPRGLDDAVDDLEALLSEAEVDGPYVLVGSSGGGFNVYHHAGLHPDHVAGLVLLDVPAGQADLTEEDVGSWADNPEHMDRVAIERQMALDRLPIPEIPVTVITATNGQSADPATQRVWLEGSSDPVQVVLEGGHGISVDDPTGVLTAIRDQLARLESS